MDGRGRFAALVAGVGAAALVAPAVHAEAQAYRFHAADVLGTSLDMVVVAERPAQAMMAAQAARGEIARLDKVLSAWRSDSELSALNRSDEMAVSADLYRVVSACEQWRTLSDGAFDARLGGPLALWREAEAAGARPDRSALEALAAEIGVSHVELDDARRTIRRPRGVTFSPDALAKGYVVDAALAAAKAASPGLAGMMIDIGGDLRCWGASGTGEGWRIGVAAWSDGDNAAGAVLIRADDRAVATSGRSDRDFRIGAETHPHLLGAHANTATVVGPTAADADALATALSVMEPQRAMALTDRLDGYEARVVDPAGAVHTSAGWQGLSVPSGGSLIRAADAPAAQAGPAWPARFQVQIDYQLPVFHELRVYSPYVAIWVTDENNRLIRAVTMLGDNLDYVSENYIWWRRYGRSRPQLVAAISKPTRKAGRYSAVWDGRDDTGKLVGQGKYTIHLEGIREDGGHSYQSIPMTLGAAAVQAGAPAEDELGATVVRYGPRK